MEVIGIACLAIFICTVGIAIFQILWNMTIPEVFGLKEIGFWQAFRLLLLASMIFGAGGYIHR